jgi:hypothetical protein
MYVGGDLHQTGVVSINLAIDSSSGECRDTTCAGGIRWRRLDLWYM